jgi:hypothetical protein
MPNYIFVNEASCLRCYDPAGGYEHRFLKRDIVSITAVNTDLLKIVVKSKLPIYFRRENILDPETALRGA